jgi:putative ABC transport system substrate-binding protein
MAQQVAPSIPVVVAGVAGDIVASGQAASYARPGGHVTGMAVPPIGGRQLQLLAEAYPALSHVAIVWDTNLGPMGPLVRETEAAAEALGARHQMMALRSPDDLEEAFETAVRDGVDSLVVLNTPLPFAQRARVVALAARHRLPATYGQRAYIEAGGLMAYVVSLPDQYRRAAAYVDKILRGAKAGDLPVEQAREWDLILNLRTAEALGITFPPSVLLLATDAVQ